MLAARRLHRLRSRVAVRLGRARGNILVSLALICIILFGLVGAGVDYGALVIEDHKMQNALDAASLVGARALVSGPNPGVTAAQTAAANNLAAHDYVNDPETTITYAFSSSQGSSVMDTIAINAVRIRPSHFWHVIGITTFTVRGRAVAAANANSLDVVLSLDLTGSMELSGTSDLPQLRQAVVDFVDQMNPDPNNPVGPKVGMARWAGVGCSWTRGNGDRNDHGGAWAPNVVNQRGDGDRHIDLNNASGSGSPSWSEYVPPCTDDKTVLSRVTYDKGTLKKLANNSGPANCPAGMSPYACPLTTYDYVPPQVYGTPATIVGFEYFNGNYSGYGITGTKLPNGISVVSDGSFHAWSTANGGRNNDNGEGWARKVLVMMTDGFNEIYPADGNPAAPTGWDTEVVNRANTLKLGPDTTVGTLDDVEIYVVGFFCTPYSTGLGVPQRWCKSRMADTQQPHPCPNNVWSDAQASDIDRLLRNISSSPSGTCTHYYPIKKTESLPQLFKIIAGAVSRGRLTD